MADAKQYDTQDQHQHKDKDHVPLDNNSCRMYEKAYPDNDELVVVQVKNIAEMGAYVQLLEYNNIEGMLLTQYMISNYNDIKPNNSSTTNCI